MASTSILLGKPVVNQIGNGSCRFKVSSAPILKGALLYFPAFSIGDHFWHIFCRADKSFILCYRGQWKNVKVTFDFGLLKEEEASSLITWKTITHTFLMCGEQLDVGNRADELTRYLKDDYFIIMCNITILSASFMGGLDSGVTILATLTGTSNSHSIENKEKASKNSTMNEMASGSFQFKVVCSLLVAKIDKFLDFPMFRLGDQFWFIRCCYQKIGYLSFYIFVQSETDDLKVNVEFGLTKKDEGISTAKWVITSQTLQKCGECIQLTKFLGGGELKRYLKYDYMRVICNITISGTSRTTKSDHDVTILRESSAQKPKSHFVNLQAPYLHDHLRNLMQNKERADVTFEVDGEIFRAHRLVLAARSPVFNTELFDPMNENHTETIKINAMKPNVFKAMLQFIYTDFLPERNDGDNMASCEMTRGLLVAANSYALERLKLMCEDMLCDEITIQNVATTLGLAERHKCPNLKAKCLEFATMPQNFQKVAITAGYRQLLIDCPAILKELGKKLDKMEK